MSRWRLRRHQEYRLRPGSATGESGSDLCDVVSTVQDRPSLTALNQTLALPFRLSMIFSENRFPLFGIML
jgi:hypothetical protein